MSPVALPDVYKNYIYPSIGLIIAGVISFVASLFMENLVITSASVLAIGCGFFIAAVMGFVIIRRVRQRKKDEITTTFKIITIAAYLASVIFIIDAAIIVADPNVNTCNGCYSREYICCFSYRINYIFCNEG